MSSDFEGYEQDFAVLTAEITSKISRVPRLPPDEKKQMVANVEKQLEEAKELLEQMDLEVREIPPQSRGMYSNRMRSYKQEMGKLETDFKRSRIAYSDEVRNELLGDDGNSSENQRAHLLDNTERLERSSRRLEAGYQIAVETEQIGQEMLENLSHDREKIQRARERLRETDANLGKSSRILTGMLRRRSRIHTALWPLRIQGLAVHSLTHPEALDVLGRLPEDSVQQCGSHPERRGSGHWVSLADHPQTCFSCSAGLRLLTASEDQLVGMEIDPESVERTRESPLLGWAEGPGLQLWVQEESQESVLEDSFRTGLLLSINWNQQTSM
ncbi:Vesicle transport through interaction with t-SNAREs-like protein 1A [Sciurus carolinensis]|uniref:Vesicle transport through interaction with t-SNAREs-like protein 1A n=1 Tax=Sciurus carolinensis TaxID=30640 RepID=A0AA41SRK8_SCICA|nr:Vesicle transport through interaction with t-SNAREs-like protein 1A [Sciurus carolinensis]